MKQSTEEGTMANLVTVNENFRNSSGSSSDDENGLASFLLETIYLTTNYAEILLVNSLSIIK